MKNLDRLATATKTSFNGSLDGRVREARPVPDRPGDQQESPISFDVNDSSSARRFMNETFIVSSTGVQTLSLKYVPIKHSEHVYWQPNGGAGLYQEMTQWLTPGTARLNVADAKGLLAAGDLLTVEYAHLNEVPSVLTALVLRGTGSATGSFASLPLPAGTQVGDLIVISIESLSSPPTMTDGRMTQVHGENESTPFYHRSYVGTATSLGNIAISTSGSSTAVIATYVGGAALDSSGHVSTTVFNQSLTLPSVPTYVGILAVSIGNATVSLGSGWPHVPSPWVKDIEAHEPTFTGAAIYRYVGTNPTPASSVSAEGNRHSVFTVIGLR